MKSNLFFSPLSIVIVLCLTFLGHREYSIGKNEVDSIKIDDELVTAVPLYRLNDEFGYHLYTTDKYFRDNLITSGWFTPEGIIGYVFTQKAKGTERFYWLMHTTDKSEGNFDFDKQTNIISFGKGYDHFYTLSEDEMLNAIGKYKYFPMGEGKGINHLLFISPTQLPGTTPVYRILQTSLKTQGHFYTSSQDERNRLVYDTQNYRDEGIVGYIWTSPVSLATAQ